MLPLQKTKEKITTNPWVTGERQASSLTINRGIIYEMPRDELFHGVYTPWEHLAVPNIEIAVEPFQPLPTRASQLYIDAFALSRLTWRAIRRQSNMRPSLFMRDPSELERDFEEQVSLWDKETGFLSSLDAKILHPSYLRIIGMGKQALPLIFEKMKRAPGHWFVALRAITGEDPTDSDVDLVTATNQWISWGRLNGFTE